MQSPNEQPPWGQSPSNQSPSNQTQTPLPPAYNNPGSQPPGYPPSGYPPSGYPPSGYPPGAPVDNSVNGTLILVLSILSLLMCQILGPVIWIMANNALATLDSGRGDPSQRQMVVTGKILGVIATILFVLLVILVVCVVAGLTILGRSIAVNSPPTTVIVPPVP